MVTQPILERKNDFKRPVIWGSFNIIWGSILSPGGPCGDLENGLKFLPAFFCVLTRFCAGQAALGCQKLR